MLIAERTRHSIEARMRADAEARYWPWYHRRQRHNRIARTAIGLVAATAMVVIIVLPQPDGMYLSNPSHRSEALFNIDQIQALTIL